MNVKRIQYFVLGVLLAIAGGVGADSMFGGGGGGAATSITSGTTTCVSGAVGRLLYTAAGLAVKCDSTSPQWGPATGTFTGAALAASADGDVTNPALRLNEWRAIGSAGANALYLFNFDSDPTDTGGFSFGESPGAGGNTNFSVYSATGTKVIGMNAGVDGAYLAAGGDLGFASDSDTPEWKISGGSLTSVGAGRNLTASGILTLGAAALAVSDLSTGKLLMASIDHPVKTFTATYDPASLAAQTGRTDTVTVTGIKLAGGAVSMSLGVDPAVGCVLGGVRASADDTVKVTWFNAITAVTACDTASSTASFTQQVN